MPPITQYMSTYILGDDLYDNSFSIETPSGEFLGECGSGISRPSAWAIPRKVTATEVWLFDKNDIRTVTKVLMSEHAYNDQALRTKLAPKGEAVWLAPNADHDSGNANAARAACASSICNMAKARCRPRVSLSG